MFEIMIRVNMAPLAKVLFEESGEIEVVIDNNKATNTHEELAGIIGDFHVLAIRKGRHTVICTWCRFEDEISCISYIF
jgi:hypothetical protein